MAASEDSGRMALPAACLANDKCVVAGKGLRFRLARSIPLALAVLAFFLFGLALTANSQITSGGTWPLYAAMMNEGVALYSDLHLPQQPLFFLYNWASYAVGGQSWLFSQISAAIVLALFCNGYLQLARRVDWSEWQKAIVFLTAAVSAIGWEYYSFFDYRAFSDIFALYALIALLRWHDEPASGRIPLKWPLVLGCLCGLSFMTRANDGVMLLVAVLCIVIHWFAQAWLRLTVGLLASAAATCLLVVLATGDSFAAYFHYTLQSAAAMKGGSGQVVLSPALLATDILRYIVHPLNLAMALFVLVSAVLPVVLIYRLRAVGERGARSLLLIALGALLLIIEAILFALASEIQRTILPWFQLALILLSIQASLAVLRVVRQDDRRRLIVLVPGGALIAAGMSSGGDHFGIFGPIGLLIVIVPLLYGDAIRGRRRAILLAIYALLAATILVGKVKVPMHWGHYRASPMFVDREIIDQPVQGPMLVDREMNGFFSEVCRTIAADGRGKSLLSLPYAYANYYCGISPWRHYVQTYFDTSSAETIDDLIRAIDTEPPTWIVYQQQLDKIRETELAFNHGQPIRHRTLDTYIWNRVRRGEWTVMRHWTDEPGSEWYFLRTSPPHRSRN